MEENKYTPQSSENELLKKQVFSDGAAESKTEEFISPSTLPEPDFYKPVVLDNTFAAKQKPVPQAKPAASAAVRRVPMPSFRPKRGKRLVPRPPFWTVRLCSGELPSDALRRIVREFGALLLFCMVILAVFGARYFVSDFMNDNAYDSLSKSTVYSDAVACRRFSVEPSDLQDGYVLAQAVCTKMDAPITDGTAFEKDIHETIFPEDVEACMERALPADRVLLKENVSNLDLLVQIHESLRENKPVIVLLSAADAPEFTLQYCAVIHMDAENDRIILENPNVGTQEYTFDDFIAATRFKNHEDMPYQMKLALQVGTWSPNTAIFVD